MNVYHSLEQVPPVAGLSVAIGNFDGLHLGHNEILEKCRESGSRPTVLTFDVHPREFLFPEFMPGLLTTKKEKYRYLEVSGVDSVVELSFERVRNMAPVDFLNMLKDYLDIQSITVGFNFFFGKNQEGNSDMLYWWGRSAGVKINVIPPFMKSGLRVSSTSVRSLILSGEIERASTLLVFPYVISGKVKKGRQLGRKMEFPTMNQGVPDKIVPPNGVYLTLTVYKDRQMKSITNIGNSPTIDVESVERRIETWVVDEKVGDMYGKSISVYFLKKIRNEIRFSSKEKLSKQILEDRLEFNGYWKSRKYGMLPFIGASNKDAKY